METKKDVKDLEVGDSVVISNRNGSYISKVARLTNTQIIITNGEKFRKNSGRSLEVQKWDFTILEHITQDEIAKRIEKIRFIKKCESIKRFNEWEKLDKEQIETVLKIIDDFHNKPKS